MRRALIAGLATGVLILSGCAAVAPEVRAHEPGSVYQLEPLPTSGPRSVVTFAVTFMSIDDLMGYASDVVVARFVSEREVPVHGGGSRLGMTDVTLRVERVLAGDLRSGEEIVVHYTGGTGERTPTLPTHPKEGLQYLMMLTTSAIDGTTRYVTGPAQWVREFDDQRFAIDLYEFEQIIPGSIIPLDISVEEMVGELRRIEADRESVGDAEIVPMPWPPRQSG